MPDRNRQRPIRFSALAQIVLPPVHHGELTRSVFNKLLPALGTRPQSFGAHQCHTFDAQQKGMIDKLSDILKGRIGNQVFMKGTIKVKEVFTMLDVCAYCGVTKRFQRGAQMTPAVTRLPETAWTPVKSFA